MTMRISHQSFDNLDANICLACAWWALDECYLSCQACLQAIQQCQLHHRIQGHACPLKWFCCLRVLASELHVFAVPV